MKTLFPDEPTALFSPCRTWRYSLRRSFGPGGQVMFLMLNPSTADEFNNDPTIRRCIGFAKAWGYGRLVVCNIFAYRATDPAVMKRAADPVGPGNDQAISDCYWESDIAVAAWGVHGDHLGRGKRLMTTLPTLLCLGKTKDGHPRHPLYVSRGQKPEPFTP